MADWRYETSTGTPDSPVGYGVLDAFGLRIGVLDGWVRSDTGEVQFVVIAVRTLLRTTRHVVPLGYVVQFDTRRRQLHLRELTRRGLPQRCPKLEGVVLPPDLVAVLHEAPHVRPEIRDMMADPAQGLRPIRPGRLTQVPEQGDGRAGPPPPVWWSPVAREINAASSLPPWELLSTLAPPQWQRLSDLAPPGDVLR